MTDEIRRIRLRAPWDGWEAKLGLRELLTDEAKWDPEPRMRVIDAAREQWIAIGREDFADDPDSIVAATWYVFLEDDVMRAYVLFERELDITKDEDWRRIAETYAYLVLQRYNREMGKQ